MNVGVDLSTIPARLQHFADHREQNTFCTFLERGRTETITFGDLFRRSAAYAAAYKSAGVKPQDLVLIILEHSPHLYYSYLGAMLAGAVPSFMPPPSPRQHIDLYWQDHVALFERLQPALIVTFPANKEAAIASIVDFDYTTLLPGDVDIELDVAYSELAGLRARRGDVACLQHSSGTTSLKKGVMLTHAALIDEIQTYSAAIGFEQTDVIASWLPLYHDMGFVACFMRSVIMGSHFVAINPFEWVLRPQMLLEAIERYDASFCWLPNFAFSHMANVIPRTKRFSLAGMRAFVNCSEPCRIEAFDRFLERFSSEGVNREMLQICYAMAENVFSVSQTQVGEAARTVRVDPEAFAEGRIQPPVDASLLMVSCGRPVDGVQIRIAGSKREVLGERSIGEIEIRSRFLFDGYYKLPEVSAERFHNGWFATRDMGFISDGELFVTGRKDDMIILNGRNYYAHEIEALITGLSEVIPGRVVAFSAFNEANDTNVVIVVAECQPDVDATELERKARATVMDRLGVAIHKVVPVPKATLVKTTSGKISRHKNRELYLTGKYTSLQ